MLGSRVTVVGTRPIRGRRSDHGSGLQSALAYPCGQQLR